MKTSRRILRSDTLASVQWKLGASYGCVFHECQLTEFASFTLKCVGQDILLGCASRDCALQTLRAALDFSLQTLPELDLPASVSCRLHFHTSKCCCPTMKRITLFSFLMLPLLWKKMCGLWFSPSFYLAARCCREEKANSCASVSWIFPVSGLGCEWWCGIHA